MNRETMLQILREVADPGKVDPVHKDEVGMLSLDELERFAHRMMAEGVKMAIGIVDGVNNYDNPMTAQDVADELRRMAEQLEKGE